MKVRELQHDAHCDEIVADADVVDVPAAPTCDATLLELAVLSQVIGPHVDGVKGQHQPINELTRLLVNVVKGVTRKLVPIVQACGERDTIFPQPHVKNGD